MARDLIDRQAVLEHYKVTDPAATFAYCDSIIEFIESLPSVEQDERWIPCSKKLPEMHDAGPMMKLLGIKEESKRVEISVKSGGVSSVISGWLRDGKWYGPDLNAYIARKISYEVTAWMPLPEPYVNE